MHGVLNLDKPGGMTSQQAVTRAKRALKVKKAGHAGTLDPMATGVLLVMIGEATKISSLLMDMPKSYEAELRLGQRTDTMDAEGSILEEVETLELPVSEIDRALDSFAGTSMQRPPMYSAIKKDGRPLYELAREGRTVEREEREINVYDIRRIGYEHPFLRISVSCSRGTYVRVLAEDIASSLGTVAHLSALRRTRVGVFSIEDSLSLERLEESISGAGEFLLPVDEAIAGLPEVVLNHRDYGHMRNGGFADSTTYGINGQGETLRLKSPERELFAIGSSRSGRIKVDRMLHLK